MQDTVKQCQFYLSRLYLASPVGWATGISSRSLAPEI